MTSPLKTTKDCSPSTTEYSLKNKTIITYSKQTGCCCLGNKANPIATEHLFKKHKTAHCTACPTPNCSNMTWRIINPESDGNRTNHKRITVTPLCVLQKEYYEEKKAYGTQERILFNKKKLRGKLFHLLQNNFIMDKTSYHLMNINTQESIHERSIFKETKHGNEYRKKHQIGIVTKKTCDLLNSIPLTRRYEDNYYTPKEFVKNNFTANDIMLFENDPVYFNLGATPINQSNLCFTKHLKERLNAEDNNKQGNTNQVTEKNNKSINEHRPFSTLPEKKKKVKMLFKINRNVPRQPKLAQSSLQYHPFNFHEYMSKLQARRELINQKQSQYQERKSEMEDMKSIKIERRKEKQMKRRSKQLLIATQLKKEHNVITTLVDILRQNYKRK